jgi:pimeloyl-ACP methyl ester carboxylesterase
VTFVLVHGGWHGGWVWQRLRPLLEEQGHRVLTPTLTGLGERAHLAHPDITPETHVADLLGVLQYEEVEDAILVGHSYGGFVITGAASRAPERVSGLVYLDAFVPTESGQSAFSIGTPERAAQIRATMTGRFLVPPSGVEHWSADEATRDWLLRMTTPHPIRCFREGPILTGREGEIQHRLYLRCLRYDPSPFAAFHARCAADSAWRTAGLDCLHDAMLDAPDLLARHLLDFAERIDAAS